MFISSYIALTLNILSTGIRWGIRFPQFSGVKIGGGPEFRWDRVLPRRLGNARREEAGQLKFNSAQNIQK